MSRRPLIAGNWKMYKTCQEAVETAGQLVDLATDADQTDIMIAPTFTALESVSKVLQGSKIQLGAQNIFWETEGAYTGEISAAMLKSAGCQQVIIGHSERRQYFNETDETVNKRIGAAIKAGLIPVFCIGETEEERDTKKTFSVLDKQVKIGLQNFASDELKDLVVAYEPVWAIGTGKTATSEIAQEVHIHVRQALAEAYGSAFADAVRILYGGSVKPNNVSELMSMPDIDGALVGGASLDAETFNQIIHF